MPATSSPRRDTIVLGVRLDPETVRLARIHRVETGEYVNDYIRRLIRQDKGADKRPKEAS